MPAKLWISPHIAGVYIITDIQYPDSGRWFLLFPLKNQKHNSELARNALQCLTTDNSDLPTRQKN